MKKVKRMIVHQDGIKDCGAACLLSIIKYYNGNISLEYLKELTNTTKSGTNFWFLKEASIKLGFSASGLKLNSLDDLKKLHLPAIAHVIMNNSYEHFVVIYDINYKRGTVIIMDPSKAMVTMAFDQFMDIWTKNILLLYPINVVSLNDRDDKIKKLIISLLKSNRSLIINILLLSIIFTICNIVNSYYFKLIIDDVLKYQALNHLYIISLIILLIIVVRNMANVFRNQLLIYINRKLDVNLTLATYNHLISLPYNYFKTRSTGEIITRMNDISSIRDMISKVIMTVLVDGILIINVGIFLYTINQSLFMISLGMLGLYLLVIIAFSKNFQKTIVKNQELNAKYTSFLIESINSFETVKGLHVESIMKEKLNYRYSALSNMWSKFQNKVNLQTFLKDTITYMGLCLILFLGGYLVMNQKLSISELITFNSLLIYFIDPIRNIIDLEPILRLSKSSLNRINELFLKDCETITEHKNGDFDENIFEICFNNLTFSYNNLINVLERFNLNIKKHDKLLVIGSSGGGKSTLFKLLLKYYEIPRNMILINHRDINDLSIDCIRNKINYISQNEVLFSDTIYNNITLGREVDYNDFLHVCEAVNLEKIGGIKTFGYELLLEENGFNLSGGERQRIILARMLLSGGEVLIFDEATSELDVISERLILKNIFKLFPYKTIIFISHRDNNKDLFQRTFDFNTLPSIRLIKKVSYEK